MKVQHYPYHAFTEQNLSCRKVLSSAVIVHTPNFTKLNGTVLFLIVYDKPAIGMQNMAK